MPPLVKTQSDSILPALESGIVRFIGSTTENPMVSMTGAVVSRCRLFQFYPLTIQDVEKAMRAALADKERGQLLVEASSRGAMRLFLKQWYRALSEIRSSVHWTMDVDPIDV